MDSDKPAPPREWWIVEYSAYKALEKERDELREQLEVERMKLVGCSMAALSNLDNPERLEKSSPYFSATYRDVCNAVDREIKYRAQVAKLTKRLKDALTNEYYSSLPEGAFPGSCEEYVAAELEKLGVDG